MQLRYVRLSTIDIGLVVGLELEDFLFELDVELVDVIELAVFFVETLPVLVNQMRHLNSSNL